MNRVNRVRVRTGWGQGGGERWWRVGRVVVKGGGGWERVGARRGEHAGVAPVAWGMGAG